MYPCKGQRRQLCKFSRDPANPQHHPIRQFSLDRIGVLPLPSSLLHLILRVPFHTDKDRDLQDVFVGLELVLGILGLSAPVEAGIVVVGFVIIVGTGAASPVSALIITERLPSAGP